MATIKDIIAALQSAGYPVAHDSFSGAMILPAICWTDEGSNDVYADNINYLQKSMFNLEMYTKYKSKTDEQKVQDILTGLGVAYSKNPTTKIAAENCFSTVYSFELLD